MSQPPTGVSRRRLLRAAGASLVGLAGCTGSPSERPRSSTETASPSPPLSGTVEIAGSSTVYPLTLAVGKRFSERHPDVDVSVISTGTGGGFDDFFCRGRTTINDASRRISDAERQTCAATGVIPVRFQVATDALTVVVNDDADWVDCLTIDELATVWREGGATTWRDVRDDWPDEPLELYGPTSASGTFDYFSETVLGSTSHRTDYEGTEQDTTIVQGVETSPYAMGYFGFAYYVQNRDAVTALAVDDGGRCVRPSFESAATGAYRPLSRPLFIYVARNALEQPVVQAFCRFYLDLATTDLARDVGYVPITDETAATNRRRFDDLVSGR